MALTATIGTGARTASDDVRRRLERGKSDVAGIAFKLVLQLALLLSLVVLVVLLGQVLSKGWNVLSTDLNGLLTRPLRALPEQAGMHQGLYGSLWICVSVVLFAFPVGIGAAIYLEEYAGHNWFTSFVNLNIRNLAGVPSVVYGILGFTVFVKALEGTTGGRSVISAGLTLAI